MIMFTLGLIAGLQLACLMLVLVFFWYGHKAKRRIRRYLMDYERRKREEIGISPGKNLS
jgi:hypothetical protein